MADKDEDVIVGQRVYGCELIQQMAILLKLPQVGASTAQVMFHRFYGKRSLRKFDVRHVAMGALFLATKVEECPRKVRDVLNVFNHLEQKRVGAPTLPLDIYSNRYAQYKERLIKAEREILKELGFILYCEHPHKFILNYVQLLTADNETRNRLAQHAWNFINDSQRTNVCIKFAPEVICCAAIWMAARVLQIKLPCSPAPWWEIFKASKAEMDVVCATVSALYSRPKAQYVRLEPPPEPTPPKAQPPAAKPAPAPAPSASEGSAGSGISAADRSAPAPAEAPAPAPAPLEDKAAAALKEALAPPPPPPRDDSRTSNGGRYDDRDRDREREKRRRSDDDDDRERRRRRDDERRDDRDRDRDRRDDRRDRDRDRDRDERRERELREGLLRSREGAK